MTRLAAVLPVLALATTSLAACNTDPKADITPRSGAWMYTEDFEVDNTCALADPLPTFDLFTLDYDEGDDFQIELGEVDATCDIDADEFECADYVFYEEQSATDDILVRFSVKWSGTLVSSTSIDASEVISVVCIGEDCNIIDDLVPCRRERTLTAEFVD